MGLRMMLAMLAVLPCVARAENNCPWLNEATASGLLGGDAVNVYQAAAADKPAQCLFTHQEAGMTRRLEITVAVVADPHAKFTAAAQVCGQSAVPMKAIGNEALTCSADDRKGTWGERVVGRVRDQVFQITLTTMVKDDPILTRGALKMRLATAAEQVAGNLF